MLRFGIFLPLALATGCSQPITSQEECRKAAAEDAASVAALNVLLSECTKEFPGQRLEDGSYAYFDQEFQIFIGVSGPKLSAGEWKAIETIRAKLRAEKGEQEKRNEQAAADAEAQLRAELEEAASQVESAADAAADAAGEAARKM